MTFYSGDPPDLPSPPPPPPPDPPPLVILGIYSKATLKTKRLPLQIPRDVRLIYIFVAFYTFSYPHPRDLSLLNSKCVACVHTLPQSGF
jgi:hypothetical protein